MLGEHSAQRYVLLSATSGCRHACSQWTLEVEALGIERSHAQCRIRGSPSLSGSSMGALQPQHGLWQPSYGIASNNPSALQQQQQQAYPQQQQGYVSQQQGYPPQQQFVRQGSYPPSLQHYPAQQQHGAFTTMQQRPAQQPQYGQQSNFDQASCGAGSQIYCS